MTPTLVVTGASGTVGSRVVAAAKARGVDVRVQPHRGPWESATWADATHVVNCAAVIPTPGVTPTQLWDGNVGFVQLLLPWLEGRHVVHLDTLSVLYRVSAYQVSKLLGRSLLIENQRRFQSLHILPLPTLADGDLVRTIAARAERGENPTVTRLRYRFCEPDEVARFVVEHHVLGWETTLGVEVRFLPDRIRSLTPSPFVEGPEQDRTGERDGWAVFNDEAAESFRSVNWE